MDEEEEDDGATDESEVTAFSRTDAIMVRLPDLFYGKLSFQKFPELEFEKSLQEVGHSFFFIYVIKIFKHTTKLSYL